MKLRLAGNSLRLRLGPGEVERLAAEGRLAETVTLGAGARGQLVYALEARPDQEAITVAWNGREITVRLGSATARSWADSDEVGLYADLPLAGETLEIAIEKDLGCRV